MKKILIIDDDEHVRYSLRRILGEDYQIVESGSGEEALSECEASRPDLVVMDVRSRRASDLETLGRMRQLDPKLPIIVMSSYGNEEAKRRTLQSGAYSFILKPFNIQELRELVSKGVEQPSA